MPLNLISSGASRGKSSEAAASRHASAETLSQSSFGGIVPVLNPLKGRLLIYEGYIGYGDVKEAWEICRLTAEISRSSTTASALQPLVLMLESAFEECASWENSPNSVRMEGLGEN